MDNGLLGQRELAQFLAISERTLEGMRQRKLGPPFIKVGRTVRYDPAAVTRWLQERTIVPAGADEARR